VNKRKTIPSLFLWGLGALVLSYAQIAAAVDSISLSPGSDITFTDSSASRTLLVQVSPAEAGVTLVVDVDTSVVGVSANTLSTDSNGTASLTITPGSQNNTVFLTVLAGGVESNAVTVTVTPDAIGPAQLNIVPSELQIDWNNNPNSQATITLVPPQITTVTIRNENPDIVTVPTSLTTDNGGRAEINIIANKKGTAKLTASLADGTVSNTLTINVTDTSTPLTTNVTQIELEMEESTTFTVTGGTGDYRWTVQDGIFDKMTGSQVTYTAPNYPDSFQVEVKDGKQTAIIHVNVTDSLRLYPKQVYLKMGEQVALEALGGKGPYKFSVLTGTATTPAPIDGAPNFAKVTAPNARGEFQIEVYDESLAKTAQSTLNVVEEMVLSPREVEVTQEGVPGTIQIQDGRPPFQVQVEKGNFKLVGRQVQIIPPVENGIYKLVVTDAIGEVAEADINVKIPGRLNISPSNPEVTLTDTITFSALGGQAPYTFESPKGTLSCNECESTVLTVTGTDSDIILWVTDSTGAKATASVNVIQPIRLEPSGSQFDLYPGESKRFNKISGGSGTYFYSTSFGRAENTIQETSDGGVIFTAPKYAGEVTLTVNDTRGSEPAIVKFNVFPVKLAITPSIRSLDMGSTNQVFEIISGEQDKRFKVWTEKGKADKKGNKILYTAPPGLATKDVLHVVSLDTAEEATAEIEIVQALSISPAMMYLDNSPQASKEFHTSGGTGTYQFRARYGTFEPQFADASETGVTVTYKSPGSMKKDEVITVTDSRGRKHSARVRINNQLRMTPEIVTLAPGASVEFIGIHGVEPYTATVTAGNATQTYVEAGEVRFQYTAPPEAGEYQITVVDANDKEVTGTIYVTADLKMTAELAVLRIDESTTITAQGGIAPYTFNTTSGYLSKTDQPGEVSYTAPVNFEGDEMTDYVTATDSNGAQVSTEIRVIKTPKSLLTANSSSFVEGDKLNLNLTVLGEGQADVYAAVYLHNEQLFFFGDNGAITPELIPYRQNLVASDKTSQENVLSFDLPNLGEGQSTLYTQLVKPGTPPTVDALLNPENHLCDFGCGLGIDQLKLKLE
jgi:hypothetical protein